MKKRMLSVLLALCMTLSLLPTALAAGETATPSPTKFLVDGRSVTIDAYAIAGSNYIKIRDMAYVINGTVKNFEVKWDGAKNTINLLSRTPYTPTAADMTKGDGQSRSAVLSTAKTYVDGAEQTFAAYVIGQSTYFKLRDVMAAFDVYVGYEAGTATLDTSKSYEGTGTAATGLTVVKRTGLSDGNNELHHDYIRSTGNHAGVEWQKYGSPVLSYLVSAQSGGFQRVQYIGASLVVEEFDKSLSFLSKKAIPAELPLFGGFYEGPSAYFILSGQENDAEDDAVEVYRVTKYDKSWNRLGHVAISNAFATTPFAFGSADMVEVGGKLYIHTCNENYTHEDGQRHQTNFLFTVDTASMRMEQMHNYKTAVEGKPSSGGKSAVCSHSFNQFIAVGTDGTMAVTGHGDGTPRAMMIAKLNPADIIGGNERGSFLPISGDSGNNFTAAQLGGLAVSSSSFLSVGATADQNPGNYATRDGLHQNVFVAATPKNNVYGTKITYLTDYAKGVVAAGNPFLVELGNDRFMILWNERPKINNTAIGYQFVSGAFAPLPVLCYTYLDGAGQQLAPIVKTRGYLSDCRPIVSGGRVMWYVSRDGNVDFYSIGIDNLSGQKPVTPGSGSETVLANALEDGWHTIGCQNSYVTVTADDRVVLGKAGAGSRFMIKRYGEGFITIQDERLRYLAPKSRDNVQDNMPIVLTDKQEPWRLVGSVKDGLRLSASRDPGRYLSFAQGADGTPALMSLNNAPAATGNTLFLTPTDAPAVPVTPPPTTAGVPARPGDVLLTVDGSFKTVDFYNIGGTAYFSLRDLAALVKGTDKGFNVAIAGDTVSLTSKAAYTPTGSESARDGSKRDPKRSAMPVKDAKPAAAALTLDGAPLTITAYDIDEEIYVGFDTLKLLGISVELDLNYSTYIVKTK